MSRVESERQWLVEGPFQWPERIGGHRGGCTEQRVVIDRYFDTGDRSLSRLGATLRLRTQEGDLVATLKRPLADDRPGARRRLELETPVDGAPAESPPFVAARDLVQGQEVVEFGVVRTERLARSYRGGGGPIEAVLDEVVYPDGGREWRVEAEGAPEDIDDFAAALATFVELTPARRGKVGELRRRLQSEPST